MGEALLSALIESGYAPGRIVVLERRVERGTELSGLYAVETAADTRIVEGADVVLLVTKPQDVQSLLSEISPHISSTSTVVSLAAGITLAALEHGLPSGTVVVRAMPNMPALVGAGMFGVTPGRWCDDQRLAAVVALLECGGEVLTVDEADQDALTAVSGSGPAYVFYLAEAMIEGGVRAGLDERTSADLTIQTIKGAAKLLEESDESAGELRQRVTSPRGTTAAAIAVFDAGGVRSTLSDGVVAAAKRSAALSAGESM